MAGAFLNRKKYILIFAVSTVLVVAAVCVYLSLLSSTVASNLMSTVDEISRHDVETIEGSLDNSYARLGSVAERMKVYDVETIEEAQEQLNLEAASSTLFDAIYLMDDQGALYSSTYVRLPPDKHAYREILAENDEHFVMLYDDVNGQLETTKESLIYGLRLDGLTIEGHRFVAMLGRSDLSTIRDQLLIESFDGQGISSVVNSRGYYIVSASPVTDLTGRNNFYDMLEGGYLEDGVTVEDVRRNIAEGNSFVINCVTSAGESLVLSFAPVEGTAWSFIMAVPTEVFAQRFAPFMTMTVGMLVAVVLVLLVMMAIVYRFMKKSLSASAESAARAEFLSNMSHEIRTPLNGIIGLNHLMERHLDDRQAMEGYVRKLGKAAQYLLSLVNDILDVSKLQAGKVELAREPFDLAATVENVCEMQREPMDEKGIALDTAGVDLPYPRLMGDEVRVSQVLMNILSNAVKFTPEGGTITVKASQRLDQGGTAVATALSIADTGCGMSPEFLDHIFDVFAQERHANTESQKGTGLGMSISHLLVRQMGGTLAVRSELGVGSCFTVEVTLPRAPEAVAADGGMGGASADGASAPARGVAQAEAAGAALKPESAEGAPAAPLKVLAAEDNELNADIIYSILTEEGYEVVLASNGQEAVDAFAASEEGDFAVVLMDAQMPVMDGYEAARAIRALDRADAATVRIFACTASTLVEDKELALASGMDDFLPKPLNVREMLAKLEEVRRCVP